MTRFGGRIARIAIRRRRAVLLTSLALSIASLLSLTRLRLDVDLLETLPSGVPAFDEYKDFLETFGVTQTLPVLIDGVEPAVLPSAIDRLAERYRALPEVAAVLSGVDRSIAAPYLDPVHAPALVPAAHFEDLARLVDPGTVAETLARAKRILAIPTGHDMSERVRIDPLGMTQVVGRSIRERYADPISGSAAKHFVSARGEAGLVVLTPAGSPFDAEFTARLFTAMATAEAETRAGDPALARLHVRHGGAFAHAREDAAMIRSDVRRYTILAFLGVIAVFHVGFRNLAVLPIVGYPLVAGSLLAFAASLLIYHQLNALSLSFAAIFYGLAIDSGIHFYTRLLEERRRFPLESAIIRTCEGIAAANVVASLTTAAAFAVIASSAIAAVRQIGVLTALGMLVNIVHTLVVLPALTVTFAGALATRAAAPHETRWVGTVAGVAARHARLVSASALLLMLAWPLWSRVVPVDADLLRLRPTGSAATLTEDAIDASFGTLAPHGVILVHGPDLETALAREERIVDWLEAHRHPSPPAIAGYQALSTFLPSLATERARRAAFAALPLAETRRALQDELERQGFRVAAFAGAQRALDADGAELPRALDAPWLAPLAARHLRQDAAATTVAVFIEPGPDMSLARIREDLRREVDPTAVITGRLLMQEELARVIAREVAWFTGITLLLNVVIVLLRLRSLGPTLAVMAPTVVVVLALLGGMELAGRTFTAINLVVLPLALGIGVDNCVYLYERVREGHPIVDSARLVGRAITLTTCTTVAGFGFLAVSRYPGLAGLGWLAALAIGLAFLAAFVFLPAFVALLARTPPPRDRA